MSESENNPDVESSTEAHYILITNNQDHKGMDNTALSSMIDCLVKRQTDELQRLIPQMIDQSQNILEIFMEYCKVKLEVHRSIFLK